MKSRSMLAYERTQLPAAMAPLVDILAPYGLSIMDEPAPGQVGGPVRRYDVICYRRVGLTTMHRHVADIKNFNTEQSLTLTFWRPYGSKADQQQALSLDAFAARLAEMARTIKRYGADADGLNDVLYYRGAVDYSRRTSAYVVNSLKGAAGVYNLRIDPDVKDRLLECGVKIDELGLYENMPTSYVKTLFNMA